MPDPFAAYQKPAKAGGDPFAQYQGEAAPAVPQGKPEYSSDLRKVPIVGKPLGWIDENLVTPGIEQTYAGLTRMFHPNALGSTPGREIAGGLSEAARGTARAIGAPFAMSGLGAPVRLAAMLAGAGTAQQVTEKGAEMLHVPEEYAHLAGDVAGTAAGVGVHNAVPDIPLGRTAAAVRGLAKGAWEGAKELPIVGKMLRIPGAAFEGMKAELKPEIPIELQAKEPFKPSGFVPKFGGTYEPNLPTGKVIPRGRFTPVEKPAEIPIELQAKEPFKPSGFVPKFGGTYEPNLPTGKVIPRGRFTPVEKPAEIPIQLQAKEPLRAPQRRPLGGLSKSKLAATTEQKGMTSAPRSPAQSRTMPGAPGVKRVEVQHLGDMRINGRTPLDPATKLTDRFGNPIRK